MKGSKKNLPWSSEEIELITNLYAQFPSKRWKRISEEFRAKGYQRSEIECREKWINFLDPQLNRNEWEEQELQRLYELHAQVGTRWCVVQKFIGRTQNQIKNRFYGTLRNLIRFVLSYFDADETCHNQNISHLSPSFLNFLYTATGDFAFLGSEIRDAIFAMKYRLDKTLLARRIADKKELYEPLNKLILQHFQTKSPELNSSTPTITPPPSSSTQPQQSPHYLMQMPAVNLWGMPVINYYWCQ